jgi:hypothetical protein
MPAAFADAPTARTTEVFPIGFRGGDGGTWVDSSGVEPVGNYNGAAVESCGSIPANCGTDGYSSEETDKFGWESLVGYFCSPELAPSKNERAEPDFRGHTQFFCSSNTNKSSASWCIEN